MGYTEFTISTTADADALHNNFMWIRGGSMMPIRITSTMDYGQDAMELGSTGVRWNNIYVNSAVGTTGVMSKTTLTTAASVWFGNKPSAFFTDHHTSGIVAVRKKYARVTWTGTPTGTALMQDVFPDIAIADIIYLRAYDYSTARNSTTYGVEITFNSTTIYQHRPTTTAATDTLEILYKV